jgi:phosphatidylserine/phosphatidylglycerophosphate/cardiolipin synthase-like enzyme
MTELFTINSDARANVFRIRPHPTRAAILRIIRAIPASKSATQSEPVLDMIRGRVAPHRLAWSCRASRRSRRWVRRDGGAVRNVFGNRSRRARPIGHSPAARLCVFYDPIALEANFSRRASLHAKCLVVDRKTCFVSSQTSQNRGKQET